VANRVAVVTGANRGIGFEICRQLAAQGIQVLLTARDTRAGEAAARELRAQNLDVSFHRLDVTREAEIRAFAAEVEGRYGAADILVNNAGILIDPKGASVLTSEPEVFEQTWQTNFMGPLNLCRAFAPLMQKKGCGRIVNLSSGLGQLSEMGGGTPAYRVSKAALNALTRMLAAELRASGILVNSACPGWVRTDMGGANAARSVAEGADTPVWLATLPDDGPSGGFFRDRQPIAW
jgi:NAD(P)-dependent dehydrogenase (short-subunit alcohol dehydrogenase family)